MTLERRTISVPVGVGQSEAEAAPYIQGNAATINARFDKRGQAAKRRPLEMVATIDPANAILSVGDVPTTIGIDGALRYDAELEAFARRNASEPRTSQARIDSVIRGRRFACNPSIAVLQDVACVVWSDREFPTVANKEGVPVPLVGTDVYYAFYRIAGDEFTLLSGPTLLDTGTVRSGHVVALETGDATRCFTIVGESSATAMRFDRYVLAAGDYTFLSGGTFGAGRAATGGGYDVAASSAGSARAFCVWRTASGGGGSYVSSITAANAVTSYNDTTAGHGDAATLHQNSVSGTLYLAQLDGTFWGLDPSLSGATAGYSGAATITAGLTPCRVVLGDGDGSGGEVLVLSDRRIYPGQAPGTITSALAWGSHVCSIRASLNEFFLPNLIVIGKPVRSGTSFERPRTILPVQGSASRRGFLISFDKLDDPLALPDDMHTALHASFSSALWCENNLITTTLIETNWVPALVVDSDLNAHFVYPVVTELEPGASGFIRSLQLDHVRARFDQHAPVRQTRATDLAIFAGGAGAGCVDGSLCADLTPQRPDPPALSPIVTDATHLPLASAQLMSVSVGWGWIDHLGREHRSAISDQVSTAWDNFTSATHPYLWVAPLPRHSSIDGERGKDLFLDVYLSMPDDPSIVRRVGRLWEPDSEAALPDCRVFYFSVGGAGSVVSATYPNGECILAFDVTAASDGDLPQPYTDTELEADAPAALVDIVSTQQRLWALSSESRFAVLVTKPIAVGYAPEFSASLSIDVPAEGGPCVGLGALDDKIVVFKRDRIYVIVGDPGDAAGGRSTVQRPRLVSGDVGCVATSSIVEGPFGVAFQSERGMMLLSRGLELTPIGERVQDTTAGLISVGVLIPREKEIRWFLALDVPGERWILNAAAVVWTYDRDQWSVWDSLAVQHQQVLGADTWSVYSSDASRETDADWSLAVYDTKITSPWIAVSGVEGFQRVWRLTALLYYYTGHVHLHVSYDYDDVSTETHTFLESVITPLRASNGRLEISIRPVRQKCAAIRIEIAEQATPGQDPPYPTTGQGITLVSIDAEIGVKDGTSRRRLAPEAKR